MPDLARSPAPVQATAPAPASPQQGVSGPQAAGNSAAQGVLADRQARGQLVTGLRAWLTTQRAEIAGLQGDARVQRIEGVLSTLEGAWARAQRGEAVDVAALPAAPAGAGAAQGLALPPELVGEVRPLVTMLEAGVSGAAKGVGGGPEGSTHSTVDWNTRLGVPEYRTQSDNLAAPEATCNVTTLAMSLERLGIGREQVLRAVEDQIKTRWIAAARKNGTITAARAEELKADLQRVDEEPGWDRDAEWKAAARRYIDGVMKDAPYQRLRGQASVSPAERDAVAGQMRDRAQMEDLLDMLVDQAGLSRYGVVGDPGKVLELVSPDGKTPDTEMLWGGTAWKTVHEKTRDTLEGGGAAALSFLHKGTRESGASHIVSVQEAKDDGFKVDDPYGTVRSSYNPKGYDDAYWSSESYQQRNAKTKKMETKEKLIADRDARKNTVNGFDDWGAATARQLDAEEARGRDTFLGKDMITRSMKYVQLFHRGKSGAPPSGG